MLQSVTCPPHLCQGILVPLVPTVFWPVIKIFFGAYLSMKYARTCTARNRRILHDFRENGANVGLRRPVIPLRMTESARRKVLPFDRKHSSTDPGYPSRVMGRLAPLICSSANSGKAGCVKNVR